MVTTLLTFNVLPSSFITENFQAFVNATKHASKHANIKLDLVS
jgi:hypothetical protein